MIAKRARWILGTEAFRFLVAGAINTIFTLVVYWILLRWIRYPVAYTISFVVGVLSGFALNTHVVFRVPWSWVRLMAFPAVHAVNYASGLAVVWTAVALLAIDPRVAPVIAAICIIPLNFLMTRYVVKPSKRPVSTDSERPNP